MVIYPIHPAVLELVTIVIIDSEAICEHDADVISRCAGNKILPDVDAPNILMQFNFLHQIDSRQICFVCNQCSLSE